MKNYFNAEIKNLQEEIRELCDSSDNKKRIQYWERYEGDDDYLWHATTKKKDEIPFTVELENVAYSKILKYSIIEYYSNPEVYVRESLRKIIWRYKNINDCSPVGKSILYWPGVGFEKSLFGFPQQFTEENAWVCREELRKRLPIEELGEIDFKTNKVMIDTINFYHEMLNIVDDDFKVLFPQWCRSPWGVAWHLRGISNLLIDIYDEPEWVKTFLDYLTKARIKYSNDRRQLIGSGKYLCNIYDDEVLSPVISPDIYRNFILPTEIRLSEYFGGVGYWHSCGNTTIFQKDINRIPNIHLVHVGPWTDLSEAEKAYDEGIVLEKVVCPNKDVMQLEKTGIESLLNDYKNTVLRHKLTVRADGFEFGKSAESCEKGIRKIQEWVEIANRVFFDDCR